MEGFNFTIPYTVRVVDVNYGAHVANSAVLNFFQDARIVYLKSLGDYSEMNIGKGCGIILPEAHVKYLAEMFLGDEFSPDGCRIWDKDTRRKMDKDRFRQDLGDVIETYKEVADRLGIKYD